MKIAKKVESPNIAGLLKKKKYFIGFISLGFFISGLVFNIPSIAMWIAFAFAAYSVIANDSIQTIGTFLASNKDMKWWVLWIFIGGIFLTTMGYSWMTYSGDVTFQRLESKGLAIAPTSFTYLQVAAPLFLLILTRLKMPVSTTFLILSCFATSAKTVSSIVLKSVSGYFIAFITAFVMWILISKFFKPEMEKIKPITKRWRVAQWISTGTLWSIWLMQDASNIAVFLPRSLSLVQFIAFAATVVAGLGWLFYKKGEKIQEVVEEKSRIQDIRAATTVDFIYAIILYIFKIQSNIPMSTTWVFIGLLAGREIAKGFMNTNEKRNVKDAIKLSLRDFSYVSLGLVISLILAVLSNEAFRRAWLGFCFLFVIGGSVFVGTAHADDKNTEIENVSFKPGKGFILKTDDGNYELQTRVRLQLLSDTTIEDDSGATDSKFQLRRARVVFKGHYYKPENTFKLELAVSPKDLGMTESKPARNSPLLDYYLDFKQLRDLNIRIGQYKLPFSRERVISSGNLSLVDRSIVNKEYTVDRDTGVTFYSKNFLGLNHLKYYAGVYTGIGRNVVSSHGFNLLYLTRLEILPFGEFKDDYSYVDFKNRNKAKMSIGLAYAYLDNARKMKGIIGDPFEDDLKHDYHFGSGDIFLKYKGLNVHTETMLRHGNKSTDRNGIGTFVQASQMVFYNPGIELAARWGTNRKLGSNSTMPENNEVMGGVNIYVSEHPFKFQIDAGKLWSEHFRQGDKRIRLQLQSSF